MAKRIIYQCDRCEAMVEQEVLQDALPGDWVQVQIVRGEDTNSMFTVDKMWCRSCWKDINRSLPREAKK